MKLRKGLGIIGIVVMVTIVLIIGVPIGIYAYLSHPDVGEFDRIAAKRVRKLCGKRSDCQVRLADLTDKEWDNFYEWTNNFTADDISRVTGKPYSGDALGRVIVLMNKGQVAYQGIGEEGVEQSLAGEVFVKCTTHTESFTTCNHGALMQVQAFETEGDPARGFTWSGTSWTLNQIN